MPHGFPGLFGALYGARREESPNLVLVDISKPLDYSQKPGMHMSSIR